MEMMLRFLVKEMNIRRHFGFQGMIKNNCSTSMGTDPYNRGTGYFRSIAGGAT
jgi:hypothetical protein